jgi:transposase
LLLRIAQTRRAFFLVSALVASVSDPEVFRTGRGLAAWIGLVPRQNSTGGKALMGRIFKQGDPYLRCLLVAGAIAAIRHRRKTGFRDDPWLADLLNRKPAKIAAVALANKNAQIAWALPASGAPYRRQPARA